MEPDAQLSVSVVVPVYNGEPTLGDLVARLTAVLAPLGPYEIVMVDDGSADGSWARIERLAATNPTLRGIRLSRNYGQHSALLAGVRAAAYDVVVTVDDDLQNPPEEIPRLLELIAGGADVVYGTPAEEQHQASRLTKLALQGAMGVETARNVSAFRAFRTRVRNAFATYDNPFVSLDVLLTWGTTRFTSVRVRHDPRAAGTSQYTFRKLFTHAMNMMTGFTTWPLRAASIVGFGFAAFGFAILAYVLGRLALAGHSVPGFPFLASIIAIFSGAQLFALGIIGEYLARMHFRMMDRPSYDILSDVGAGGRRVAVDGERDARSG
jgi:undecaprenyl-phosphate 4-deoxy-4-formamido-L-arabinose transferase